MKTMKSRFASITSVSAVSLLLLSACAGNNNDDNGNGENEAEEAVDAALPEERLNDYWVQGQNAMSEEELNEVGIMATSGPENDETLDMLTANEELTSIVDEYFDEPELSDEQLESYDLSSNDELLYSMAIFPAQMDQIMGFAASFQEEEGENAESTDDDSLSDSTKGVHILRADDVEGSDSDTASVSFVPNSLVSAYQSLSPEGEDLSEGEVVEHIQQDGEEDFLSFWFVFADGEWVIDTEATINSLAEFGAVGAEGTTNDAEENTSTPDEADSNENDQENEGN